MTNKKSTKKALLTSALSLLLCLSMLVGTTFAWFTDEVKSANNIITAGNLDVELEYAKVIDGTLQGWNSVAGKSDIFDPNALWEPGRVEVVYLKVSNLGTLELKYQLGVNVYDELPGTNVDGETFELSDYLVFKAVEMPDAMTTYTDREAVQLAAGTEKGLVDYNGTTTRLEVGGVDYVALIVYMPETVGNEANYMTGTSAPQITLGVNLYATQKDAESDSFGSDYDEDAWHPDMIVYNAADLKAALTNGGNIQLGANIELTEAWTPIGTQEAPFSGTFDGNGYTISNLTITDGEYAAMFAYLDGATIRNLTLKNVDVTGKQAAAVAGFADNTTIENIEVSGSVASTKNYAAGVVVRGTGNTIRNCENSATVNGAYLGAGIAAWMPSAIIEGCENYGSVTGAERAAGIVALVSGTVTDCTNNGDVTANGSMPAGGIVAVVNGATTIEGCTNNGNVTATANSKYNASAAGILGHTPSAKVSIIDCVNTGKITSAYSVAAGIGVSQYGGITATNCSNSGEINGATASDDTVAAKGMFGGKNTIN